MNQREKKLLGLFRGLSRERQDGLLEYAEFLRERDHPTDEPVPVLVDVPRPDKETVVGAMKRLTATYPMLETRDLLNQASTLMAQHILQGRHSREVIDELEHIFRTAYEDWNQAGDRRRGRKQRAESPG